MRLLRSPATPFLLALLLLLPTAAARAQESDLAKVMALAARDSRVMEHVDHLANRIGPRLTGSHAYDNACAWAVARFTEYGLQNVRLERWGEVAVGFNRGPASGSMLAPEVRTLTFGTPAWSAGTRGLVEGRALLAPVTEQELEAARAALAGAWIVERAAGPDAPRPSRELREARAKAYDEAGVAGVLRGGRGELILTSGSMRLEWDRLPRTPSITLLAADHAAIVAHLEAGREVRLAFDIRNWFERGPIPQHNVVAELPGTERPDEVVIVSGHLDSWDGATGATDNGTGVATTLEAARLLATAGARPKRTIRFILWGGEEQGLLGSSAYVKDHAGELARISAVLVHDEGTNYCAGIPASTAIAPVLREVFAPVATLDPEMPFEVKEFPEGLSGGGSDHAPFLRAGVPGLFWIQKGRAVYRRTHHTQFDTYDAVIPEYQRNSAIVIAVGALGIANLPELLPREKLAAPRRGGGRRMLGVQLGEGMAIEEVVEDSPAARAGLRPGDVLLAVGGQAVADNAELREALQAAGTKSTVRLRRASEELELPIEFPPAPERSPERSPERTPERPPQPAPGRAPDPAPAPR
jgi:hypothetical protein